MDNYKIKVKDEAESKEAQELFFELGYSWQGCGKYYNRIGNYAFITAYPDEMLLRMGWGGDTDKELTLPQLRDLVVLKRNDVKDANYRSTKVSDGHYFKSSDGKFYFMFEGCWVVSEIDTDEGLEPITKAQGLISGAEAMTHAINGEYVEFFAKGGTGKWNNFNDEDWSVDDLKSPCYQFRLKPPTLTVNAELPKPSNTTFHNQNYSVTYEFGSREERNAFVEGLGGNNS